MRTSNLILSLSIAGVLAGCGRDSGTASGPSFVFIDPGPGEGGGSSVPCYVQEGDLGTHVAFTGIDNPCDEPITFNGMTRSIEIRYQPTLTPGGGPWFSAVYVLSYTSASSFEAERVSVRTFTGSLVTHSVPIDPESNLAGIRIRSFVGACPPGVTNATACFEQSYASGANIHDELHVCIDNTANSQWTDPEIYCLAGLGQNAPRPSAQWTYTVTVPPLTADVAYYDFDASGSIGIGTLSFYWDNWNAPNTGWPGACSAPWVQQATGPTYEQGASGLLWSVRVRLRVVDAQNNDDTVQLQLAGDCP